MDGWLDSWTDRWIDRELNERMGRQTNREIMGRPEDELTGWIDRKMTSMAGLGRLLDGQTNG